MTRTKKILDLFEQEPAQDLEDVRVALIKAVKKEKNIHILRNYMNSIKSILDARMEELKRAYKT